MIQVKVFEQELTKKQTQDLIGGITDVVTSVTSDKLRDVTWVVVDEVPSGNWGIGGKALGLDDVKKILEGG
ncbi:MAG: 4-oxalocrotonate tautomerase family protein [Myxococcales bacterium]